MSSSDSPNESDCQIFDLPSDSESDWDQRWFDEYDIPMVSPKVNHSTSIFDNTSLLSTAPDESCGFIDSIFSQAYRYLFLRN